MSIAALCVFSVQFEYQLSGPFERRLANSAVQTQSGTVTASTRYFRHIVAAAEIYGRTVTDFIITRHEINRVSTPLFTTFRAAKSTQ